VACHLYYDHEKETGEGPPSDAGPATEPAAEVASDD
jgi:hypothetical protein